MLMTWLVGQHHTALRAESGAIRPAHRRERELESHGVDDGLLEVDPVVDHPTDFVFLGGRLGCAVRVGEQFGQRHLNAAVDRSQATDAFTHGGPGHRSGDQHAFRYRFDPQVEIQRSTLRIAIMSSPMRAGLATVLRRVTIEPGRRPSRVTSMDIGEAERCCAVLLCCRAIEKYYGAGQPRPRRRGSAHGYPA